jgi:hypothetical protein
MKSKIYETLHYTKFPCFLSLLFKCFHQLLVSKAFGLCSFLNVRDQVSYQYKTTDNVFRFLDRRQEDRKFWTSHVCWQALAQFNEPFTLLDLRFLQRWLWRVHVWLTLRSWRWNRHIHHKHLLSFIELHAVTTQKTELSVALKLFLNAKITLLYDRIASSTFVCMS